MTRRVLLMFAPVLLSGVTAFAQDTGSGWTPALLVRGLRSGPEGTVAPVSGDRKLVKDEPGTMTIWTGRSLCSLGIGSGEPMQVSGPPSNVWRMTSEYLGEQNGRYQVRVTAGFTRLAGRDLSSMTTQTLSLREGDAVVLDALTAAPDASCNAHVVTIEGRLIMQPSDRALARARYVADMWLVHVDPSGLERRQHMVTNIDGSASIPFMFNRIGFPLPPVDPRQGQAEVIVQLTGALRLRPRLDGQIDVDVETGPMLFRAERPDKPFDESLFGTSRKTLTVKIDETTAIDFPARGTSSLALASGSGAAGGFVGGRGGASNLTGARHDMPLAVVNDRLVVNMAAFFKGHRTQLLIRLRRAE